MAARLTGDERIWHVDLRGLPIQPSLGIDDPVQRQNHSLVDATRRRNLRADLLDDESVAPAFQLLRVDAECAEVNRKRKLSRISRLMNAPLPPAPIPAVCTCMSR